MRRLLVIVALFGATEAAAKGPLTLSEIASLGRFVDCYEACPPLPATPTYDQHLGRQTCLSTCGEPPRVWEKNGVAPVDRKDLDLAFLEYQHHTFGNSTKHICYADADQTIVVPAALCASPVCQQVATCSAPDCALPAQGLPTCQNVGGNYVCMWPAGKRPARCPAVVCSLAPVRNAVNCGDADGDKIPKWLDDGLRTSGATKGDAALDTLCSSDKPCKFNQLCQITGALPGGTCRTRACPGGTCTAFHLELVAQDDTQAIVHVHYDFSPIPARVLDLPVVYDRTALDLVDSRLLPAVALYHKQLATQHLSDGTLRLSIFDPESSEPIPFGPIVELVFARVGDGPTSIAFSKVDALQQAALAPVQGSLTGPQQELAADGLWGAAVSLVARAAVPTKLRYWLSMDDLAAPFAYLNVPTAEELCARWPECQNTTDPKTVERILQQLDELQAGRVTATRVVDGVAGAAAVLDGNQDHLRLPVDFGKPLLADAQSASVAFWFLAEGDGPSVLFSHNGFNERTAVALRFVPSGATGDLVLQAGDVLSAPGAGTSFPLAQGIPIKTWHHVAFTLDAASGQVSVWFDGAPRPPVQLPAASGPAFIKCPQFPNTIDVLQAYEGGIKGNLSGSTPPERVYLGAVDAVRATIDRMTAAGTERETLLAASDAGFRDVDYSPANDRIAFASDASGAWEIWIARPDGTDRKQVTAGFGDKQLGFRARRPRWSPDGSALVFESNAFDVLRQDNTYRRVYHLYLLRYDAEDEAITATLPGGTVLPQLGYTARVDDGTIRTFRITEASVDRHTMNARWLERPGPTTLGSLVADRSDVDFKGHEVVRLALATPLPTTPATAIPGLTAAGQTEPRLLAARRYTTFAAGVPQAKDVLLYEVRTAAGPLPYLATSIQLTGQPPGAVQRTLIPASATLGTMEDAALAPELDPASQLPNAIVAMLPPTGRPALLRTVTPATFAGAVSLSERSTRVRGISWVREPRLYPCEWAGGFQHPSQKVMTQGFRGALDDLRVHAGLRDPDAIRSEFERGWAILQRDGKTGAQPTLFDPTCTGHSDCAPEKVCVRPPPGAAGTCQIVTCNPTAQPACPGGGRCWPVPPGVASPTGHVCIADCDSDEHCAAEQCANGICRFCDEGSCSECRTTTTPAGVSTTVGCPDQKAFACNPVGACITACYAFDDGESRYLCDPVTTYCQAGYCVPHVWSWWDLAPAGFGGLGEMRRDVPPVAGLFERYRMAVDQRAVVKLTAYGVEDLEEEPEVLVEAKGGAFYGGAWKEIGRVSVTARTPSEAALSPLVVTAWPFESLRLRLVVPPYGNPSAGATGFDAPKDQPFCPSDASAPNAPAGMSAACVARPPGSAAHLGYGPVPRWQGIAECSARDRSGCPGHDAQNAFAYLRGGYPAVAVVDVAVNGNRIAPSKNDVCTYRGTTVPTEANGQPRRLWFGGDPAIPERSAARSAECPAGAPCPPAAGGATGLANFNVAQAGFALLNCPWNPAGGTPAAVTYNGPVLYNSDISQPVGDIVRDDGEICTVEAGASLAPCYALAGQDASCDPGNTAIDVGVSTPFNTLDFATFRYFGHDDGFTRVVLPRANLSVTVAGLAGPTLDVAVAGKTLSFTAAGTQVAASLKEGERYSARITRQPALANHGCFLQGAASGNMTPTGATIAVGCQTLRTVGGQVQALGTGSVVLRMAHSGVAEADVDELEVTGAGGLTPFTFASALPAGQVYTVTVTRQPVGSRCSAFRFVSYTIPLAAASGTIGSANVTAIAVTCAPVQLQPVQVSVTGLLGGGLRLVDRATTTYLSVSANGLASFPTTRTPGTAFELLVVDHPKSPAQVCTLGAGAAGTVGTAPVVVPLVCTTLPTFPIAGAAYGVIGTGLSIGLELAGSTVATEVLVPANPPGGAIPITFGPQGASGQSFAVKVLSHPVAPEQVCSVTAGSGTVEGAAPVAFAVICVPKPSEKSFTVGGAVAGLQGTGLRLVLTGVQKVEVSQNGVFTFPTPLLDGNEYTVTVARQPSNPTQSCTVTNGSGTIQGTNVTSVAVECVDAGLVSVTLTYLEELEGAGIKAFLYTLQAPVKLVAVAPAGIAIAAGQATFNMKVITTAQPGQSEPDALLPAGAYGLVVLVNADGSTDTATGSALFNPGDKGTFAQVAVAVRQVNTVTIAGTKDLQKGRVQPQNTLPLVPVSGRVTCYWTPSGQKALPLPPNPKILPIFATTTQCSPDPCKSSDPLKKLTDEGVLFGAPGLAFDVTCWHDVDDSGSLTTGDTFGSKLSVTDTSPVLVLDQTK